MYYIKQELNLTQNGIIANNVKIENNKLIITHDTDTITCDNGKWYVNGFYQGDGASFNYTIVESEIVNMELAKNIFENENSKQEN